jgi:predicted phage tail protein
VAGANPAPWTVALIAGEVALGVLTLSNRWGRRGLIAGATFSAFLFTLGTPYTLMMGGYAVLLAWLAERTGKNRSGAAPD